MNRQELKVFKTKHTSDTSLKIIKNMSSDQKLGKYFKRLSISI